MCLTGKKIAFFIYSGTHRDDKRYILRSIQKQYSILHVAGV